MFRAERWKIGGADDLPVDGVAVAPDDLDEFQRERPLDVCRQRSLTAGALNSVSWNQHLSCRHKEIAAAERLQDDAPVLCRPWHVCELDVVHGKRRVEVVLRSFLI